MDPRLLTTMVGGAIVIYLVVAVAFYLYETRGNGEDKTHLWVVVAVVIGNVIVATTPFPPPG